MAIGAAIVGMVQGARAAKEAKRGRAAASLAGATAEEQQKATTAEEIRRQKYAFKSDTASIEAAIAAGGISDPTALRKTADEMSTGYETEIDTASASLSDKKAALEARWGKEDKARAEYRGGWETSSSRERGKIRSEARKREMEELVATEEGKIAGVKEKHQAELDQPWSKKGGIFSTYLRERQDVHAKEVGWMEKTGLSAAKLIQANTQSAIRTARGQEMQAYGSMVSSFSTLGNKAGWWK